MSQIKYLQQTYGGTPFMFFEDKAAAEAAGTAGQIPDGVVVCTLNDTIGQMMASAVGYDNTESGLEAETVQGAIDETNEIIRGSINRKTRRQLSESDLTALKAAISTGDFTGLNIKDGDYFSGASGLKYTLADYNHFKGNTAQNAVISDNHYAVVVDCMGTTAWQSTSPVTGGYKDSTLRTYLRNTALPKVLSDMQALGFTVISRQCIEGNIVDDTRVNRWGQATGATAGREWVAEQIIALSEPQVFGNVIAGSSFFDVGEANRQLNCFKEHSFMDIADMKYFWLKELSAAGYACYANGYNGNAGGSDSVTGKNPAFGLIEIK